MLKRWRSADRGGDVLVLRLCSVFEVPPGSLVAARRFDAVGGMQIHTSRLTSELDARGVEQVVVTAYRPGAPRTERVGTRARVVRTGVPIARFRQLWAAAAIPTIARLRNVDLVHVHVGEDLAVVPLARWAASRARAPLVVTMHCSLQHTLARHDLRSLVLRAAGARAELRAQREADAVLVLTERLAMGIVASGVSSSRVRVVPVGIDLEAFAQPVPRPEEMDGERWIVYGGRLVMEKGVSDLLVAFSRIDAPNVGLLLVGEGPARGVVLNLARKLGVGDRVRLVGPVPHGLMPRYLQHAEMVVLPSWYEERGRILLEAMAAGRPVVATATGGIPETVHDGINGLLVPPRNPVRLAAAIDRLLGDPHLAAGLAEAGRSRAEGHATPALADATLSSYEAVLGGTVDVGRGRTTRTNDANNAGT
jgi:glycosyltransferase involved in cell wall biosynthesis